MQDITNAVTTAGSNTISYLSNMVSSEPQAQDPVQKGEDEVVEAVLTGLEKIATDTIDMAETIKKLRGGDRKQLAKAIMGGLKGIAQDAIDMTGQIQKEIVADMKPGQAI